jgi:hypothetical protein
MSTAIQRPNRLSRAARVLAFPAIAGIGAFAFLFTSDFSSARPATLDLTQAEICNVAHAYAAERLMDELNRAVTLGDCTPLSPVPGAEGVWNVNGVADATQYGAPVRITWTANVFRTAEGGPRVCAFGSNSRAYPPRALTFTKCG